MRTSTREKCNTLTNEKGRSTMDFHAALAEALTIYAFVTMFLLKGSIAG